MTMGEPIKAVREVMLLEKESSLVLRSTLAPVVCAAWRHGRNIFGSKRAGKGAKCATLAVIVGIEDDEDIFDRHHHDQTPDDE